MCRLPFVRLWLSMLTLCFAVAAQAPSEAIRAAMQRSIDQQLASVQRQRATLRSWNAQTIVAADCDPLPAAVLEPLITETAKKEGLAPSVVREVARRESGFRPCAVSDKGALGIMQLMPDTADAFSVRDPFDPRENIAAGGRFLRQLLDRYGGDVALALGAYNAGPGRVDRAGGVPPIAETREYVKSILARLPSF